MLDFIVVGGGPVGMSASIELAKLNKQVLLIDACEELGGQLAMLYPEKEIVDLKDIASIRAIDYIKSLEEKMHTYTNLSIMLNTRIISFTNTQDCIEVTTSSSTLTTKHLILATGLGSFLPRKMDIPLQDECKNILYSLKDKASLKGKKVLVLGGGDSALDWTKEISKISDNVSIIHRRNEFRGDIKTIENVTNIQILTPYIPLEIIKKDDHLTHLIVKNVADNSIMTLPADYVFVNFGFLPLADTFGLPNENGGILVNKDMSVQGNNVFAIGDVARYENKVRRIEPALIELEILLSKFR